MYLALARKYRPQRFADLIGQPHITKTLQNAINTDKLYPGLIFSGMKGVGKTSAARILAKALNCAKGPASEPCNECEACREITGDKSPDYIEIDGASNNGVEEIRNLKETVKYRPLKNRSRVVVIDEVHMLSNSAWNALLKTIEEPPDHTYFIMATTDFHKIPATIISRCQHFEFKRIPHEVIVKLLKEICIKENITISDYALFLVARSSEGSLRDAKKILDQAIALSEGGDVKDQNVIDILGVIDEETFIDLSKNIFTKDRKAIIEQVNTLAERGMDLRFFYNEYLKFLRDLMVLKSLDESEKLHNLNPENIPRIKEILKNVREIELLRYFNAAKDLEQTMRNTENPRIILEYLFLKLSYFSSLVSIEDLINEVKSGRRAVERTVQQPASPSSSPSPSPMDAVVSGAAAATASARTSQPGGNAGAGAAVDAEHLKNLLVEKISPERPRWAPALGAAAFEMGDSKLVITLTADFELAYNTIMDQPDYLKKTVLGILKRNIDIEIALADTSAKNENAKIENLKTDEKITNLMDKIKGKIVNIE
ncbi:MAG: DNA polymerase III subunit gamma/tau [Candidatus Aminicenantes bacterium]|nr:DNA polymerase III subunit gamma/tau [Candidatus Aminicenantes bacterium]